MAITRNPTQFLRRIGEIDEPARPRPRLDIHALRVHTIPIATPPLPPDHLEHQFEGSPPPDRGGSRPYPGVLS